MSTRKLVGLLSIPVMMVVAAGTDLFEVASHAAGVDVASAISPTRTPTPAIPSPTEVRAAMMGQATPTPRPRVIVVGSTTPTPKVSVSPAATPTPMPTPVQSIQTLADLQSKIRGKVLSPELARGRIGIKITSLNSGKVVFENDAEKYFIPASNMKNFTVSTALERLGPDFKFVTSVRAPSPPDSNGTIKGNLTIQGRGDVSISTSFDPAFPQTINHFRGIDMLVDKIVAAGVKRIEGDLVADESYFVGFAIPDTWEWDDLETYSGTEISAFPLNDNVIDISIKPGSAAGQPCVLSTRPATMLVRFINKCTTTSGGQTAVKIKRAIYQNVVEVTGSAGINAAEDFESTTFTHMADLFIELLRQRMLARGITITGSIRTVNDRRLTMCPTCPGVTDQTLTTLESPPLSVIAAKTMKPSQNMFTETLLWTVGENLRRKGEDINYANSYDGKKVPLGDPLSNYTSSQIGIGVVRSFMTQIGVPPDGYVQYDGSGMSRHDQITPAAVVRLYTYMAKESKYSQVWRDSLTIGGVDGTLRNRFKGTRAEANMRGKTGTLDQVSALSGYVTTAGGEQLVVSIIVNGVPGGSSTRTSIMDQIVVALADFNGRID